MKFDGKSQRLRERLKLTLPVRVYCRGATAGQEWTEMSRLLDVTPFGASFTLAHLVEPGRLLQLTLAMPRQLRCFDHVEQQYRVWALVRRVRRHEQPDAAHVEKKNVGLRFEVGVAFIGKHPPASFERDPTIRYEVAASRKEGLWEIREKVTQDETPGQPAVSRSKDTRLQMAVEVVIEVLDGQGGVMQREETATENISRRGAAVWTTLELEAGSFVLLTGVRSQFSVFAVVRGRRKGADGIPRLHLEFIDRQWPLEGVE